MAAKNPYTDDQVDLIKEAALRVWNKHFRGQARAQVKMATELARAGLGAEPSPETPTDWVPVFVTVHNPDPKAIKTGRLLLSVYEPGDSADLAMFDMDREEWTRVVRGGATAMTCVTVRTSRPVRPSQVHVRGKFVLTSSYGSGEFVP